MKPILVVDAYFDPAGGAHNLVGRLGERPYAVVRPVHDGRFPTDAGAYAGILITGSAASVRDPHPWLLPAAELVRDAARRGVPVLGLCFGHQLIAHALLGPDRVVLAATPELGFETVERTEASAADPILAGVEDRFLTFESHRDEVRPRSGELTILASNAACAVQAFRVGDQPIWGVQFHPEMGPSEIRALIAERVAQDTGGRFDADALVAEIVDTGALGDLIVANFLEQVEACAPAAP